MSDTQQIFQWVPNYLVWLNLVWSGHGPDRYLAEVRKASDFLSQDPKLWSAAIRDANWRCPLAAYACLLATGQRGFLEDLRFRFLCGGMVTPQIAVALGLLHPGEAIEIFEPFAASVEAKHGPHQVVSAQTVLHLLGQLPESQIRLTGWSFIDRDYAELATKVVRKHWHFWSPRV